MTKLVNGYRTTGADTAEGWEMLYAVFDDGRVYRTDKLSIYNTQFTTPARRWFRVDALPEGAEWIGHYPAPVASAK